MSKNMSKITNVSQFVHHYAYRSTQAVLSSFYSVSKLSVSLATKDLYSYLDFNITVLSRLYVNVRTVPTAMDY